MKSIGFDARSTSSRSTTARRSRRRCSAWKGRSTPDADGEDRRRQAGDLRRLPGGRRRPALPGRGRHPRRRAVRGRDPADAPRAVTSACPAEKSGQDEFDFEYGEDFAQHIEAFHPTFCKVLVRYNPEGDRRAEPAADRAPEAAVGLPARESRSRFMFELLVPPEKEPARTVRRRQEGVRPEAPAGADGAGHPAAAERAGSSPTSGRSKGSTAARTARGSSPPRAAAGGSKVGCIVLGRGRTTGKSASG